MLEHCAEPFHLKGLSEISDLSSRDMTAACVGLLGCAGITIQYSGEGNASEIRFLGYISGKFVQKIVRLC